VNLASALLRFPSTLFPIFLFPLLSFPFIFLFPYPSDGMAKPERHSCCNPSTYCARASDGSIGCCPWGTTCAPSLGGAAAPQQSTWQPAPSTWQPQASTVYVTQTHPTTVVYAGGGQPEPQQATTVYSGLVGQGQGQQYCSTLYAHGPNLPTTEAGTCGTILIANDAVKGVGGTRWMVLGIGMVVLELIL
jgi:hypothetical protein